MKEVNEIKELEEVVNMNDKVILDFSAPWCVPCKKIAGMLENIEQNNPSIVIVKVNIEEALDAVELFEIKNVPTLVYYKNHEVKCKTFGVTTQAAIQEKIDAHLL